MTNDNDLEEPILGACWAVGPNSMLDHNGARILFTTFCIAVQVLDNAKRRPTWTITRARGVTDARRLAASQTAHWSQGDKGEDLVVTPLEVLIYPSEIVALGDQRMPPALRTRIYAALDRKTGPRIAD